MMQQRDARPHRAVLWGLTIGSCVGAAYLFGLFDVLELKALDGRFLLRGEQRPRSPIVIVAIDEDSFDELGLQWPWPRTMHATLIETLRRGGPAIIGVDILFTESSRDSRADLALAQALQQAGNVVMAAFFSVVEGDLVIKEDLNLPIPLLRERAAGYGFVNLPIDADGFIRRAILVRAHQEQLQSSFIHRLLQLASAAPGTDPPSRGPVLINFRGPSGIFPTIPYYQVLRGEVTPETFRGKIVLVGTTTPALHDLFPTPFAARQRMPGVEIQANLLETLLQGIALRHPSSPFHLLLLMTWALAAAVIGFHFRPLKAFGLVAGLGLVYALANVLAFMFFNLWLEIIAPSSALFTAYGAVVLRNYAQEEREKRRLARYFSPAVLQEIVRYPDKLSVGSDRRRVTILFSDIRGFTSISERLPPEEVVDLLGEYLTAMSEIIFKHGGVIDKFIGDAIMALYGVPLPYEDHAARAVRTAIEMQEQTSRLSPRWVAACGEPLKVGIGINTGEAVVGSMGSVQRLEYTAIGDTVNLASRLEGLTKDFETSIVISQETQQEISGLLDASPLGQIKVKGRAAQVRVYAVGKRLHSRVPTAMPVTITLVVSEDEEVSWHASIKNLSKGGATVQTPKIIPAGQEVRIDFSLPDTRAMFGARGRVAWSHAGEIGIEFLDVTTAQVAAIEECLQSDRVAAPALKDGLVSTGSTGGEKR
ncbi:MAG: CHASE2 domain-containing protein [candidate division NC10 bacterium]|nr:CHASE2 domain-containing protein [candidate division NC10 bacterium]MDE2485408.1 CHASE2 domain-containing protein [candidate division NC10 bacterium]